MVLENIKTYYSILTEMLLKKLTLMLLIAFSISIVTSAQTDSLSEGRIVNQQIWLDFYSHYTISDKVEYYGDAGYRSIITEKSWNRIYIRPSFRYKIHKKIELHTGVGLFYVFDKYDYNTLEITPWQGVQVNWPRGKRIRFKHMLKIEERFNYITDTWVSSFELRFRYKMSAKVKINDKWFIPGYLEYFLPFSLQGSEEIYQNKGRAGLGIGYNFSSEFKVAFLFNWQTSRSGINENLKVSDYAYQLKIIKVWTGKYLFSREAVEDNYY